MKTEGEVIDRHEDRRRGHRQTCRHEDRRRGHRQTDMKTKGEAIDRQT